VGDVRGIDEAKVSAWLEANIGGLTPPLSFELIVGGHSNLTYRIEDAKGDSFVLRRPPLGAVLATAHDMAREHRIITAVGKTPVPVPPALGLCEDEEVNGAPFYVMAFVEGTVLATSREVEALYDEADRQQLSEHVVSVLAELHEAEPDDIGLGDLGRREAYLERQLRRWHTQWEKSKTRELATMEEVYQGLSQDRPVQIGSAIVHGDYRLGNMISSADARVAAVLDWELCTLGDPLADLGYLLNNWAEPDEEGPTARGAALSPSAAGGFYTRDQLIERYQALTGRDTSKVDYYRAFQYWRLAAIVEGVLSRYMKGVMGEGGDTDAFRAQVDGLAAAALEMLNRLRS